MKGKHQKHPPMTRPNKGKYHISEFGIYGTNCGRISEIVSEIKQNLNDDLELIYVDADHDVEKLNTFLQVGKKQFQRSGELHWNEYDDRMFHWSGDIVLVNGNHYPANKQIVVIDPKKKDSLFRRIEQLTDISVVLASNDSEIFDFVRTKMTDTTIVLDIQDISNLTAFLKENVMKNVPSLKALILAGGKSQRMNEDKSQIDYHGAKHEYYLADLCEKLGVETFLSKSHDYVKTENYPVINDRMINMGPYGAILTAFINDPDSAWLVLACDLPFMNSECIDLLIKSRDFRKHATAYKVSDQRFPEPLMAIYEPRIYQRMLRFMSIGYACPRKVLINSEVNVIDLSDDQYAFNANTQEEKAKAKKIIRNINE